METRGIYCGPRIVNSSSVSSLLTAFCCHAVRDAPVTIPSNVTTDYRNKKLNTRKAMEHRNAAKTILLFLCLLLLSSPP